MCLTPGRKYHPARESKPLDDIVISCLDSKCRFTPRFVAKKNYASIGVILTLNAWGLFAIVVEISTVGTYRIEYRRASKVAD